LLSDEWCDDLYRRILKNHLNTPQEKAAWSRYTNHGARGSNRDIELSPGDVKTIAESIDGVKEVVDNARSQAQSGVNVDVHTSRGGSAPAPWIRAIGGVSIEITASGKYKCFSYTYRINDPYDFDVKWIRGDFSRSWKAEAQTAAVAAAETCLGCNWEVFNHVGEYRGK